MAQANACSRPPEPTMRMFIPASCRANTSMMPPIEMLRYHRRNQCRRVDLADDGFEIGQAAHDRMDRDYFAIPGRSQRHEAEINNRAEHFYFVGSGRGALERIRYYV